MVNCWISESIYDALKDVGELPVVTNVDGLCNMHTYSYLYR